MNRSTALRSTLVSVVLVLLGSAAWLTLAPTGVGGSTEYVTTHGNSMAPHFRTGDLVLLRKAGDYRAGDVVAYRSTLLHSVVLHRIIARDGDRYVFKGDHNTFVDPGSHERSELVGRLWVRVPQGGTVLGWLRLPYVAGALVGAVALLLLAGATTRRRRRRRRSAFAASQAPPAFKVVLPPAPAAPHVSSVPPVMGGLMFAPARPPAPVVEAPAEPEPAPVVVLAPPAVAAPARPAPRVDGRQILLGAAVAAAVSVAAGVVAFATPTRTTTSFKSAYSERVDFGYHATASRTAGPVYPAGILQTGDPVFLRLVHRVNVSVGYRFRAGAPHVLGGTMDVILRISGQSGWSRDLPLAAAVPFEGDRADADVTLDLARIRRLTGQVERLAGLPAGGTYSLAVIPRVHATGTLAGQQLASSFAPQMGFQLDRLQLRAGDASPKAGDPSSRTASVPVPRSVANAWEIRGHGLSVSPARWIALAALLLSLVALLLSRLARFRRPADPSGRVRARHGHLIVPIAAVPSVAGRTAVDVTTIDALVALAERADRLILHHHAPDEDTYLVDDGGALFRFRIAGDAPAPLLRATA